METPNFDDDGGPNPDEISRGHFRCRKTKHKLDAPYVPRIAYDTKSRFFLPARAESEGR